MGLVAILAFVGVVMLLAWWVLGGAPAVANLRTIGPRSGGASFLIATQDYKRVLTNMRFEYNTAQDDETTFGDEPNPKFGEGPSIGRVAGAGILKEGDAEAGPILPLPQGVSVSQVYSTGNTLAYTANFARLVVERSAMGKGILAFEAVIISAIVKTWNTTT